MFGLFKRKEKKPEAPETIETQPLSGDSVQLRAFSSQFLPKELEIQAVTGAAEFNGSKAGTKELWIASTSLTAWREENSPEIHQGTFTLTTLGDDQLLEILRRRAPWDTVIKFRGRVSEDGMALLLLNLPEPGSDLELKMILRKQKQPVTLEEEGLGTFYLNREVNWFEAEVDWLGSEIILVFGQERNREDCVRHARTLLAEAESWDERIRASAADELLELANDWAAAEDEDGEPAEITREEFMERMELNTVEIREDGSFSFWFEDGEMFYGHTIRVSGDLEHGPKRVDMEG